MTIEQTVKIKFDYRFGINVAKTFNCYRKAEWISDTIAKSVFEASNFNAVEL